MPIPVEQKDSRLMRAMFSTIAPRYDFITRAFSYGMDRRWKRRAVARIDLPPSPRVLDLASGTGDFSRLAVERDPGARAIAVDLTESMLHHARRRGTGEAVCADATSLPFGDGSFDCVLIGYGLRNFPNLRAALEEIERVTRPGGFLVTLDFFLPRNRLLRRCYLTYLYVQGAFWGLLLHGRPRVYTYIPDSLRAFLSMADFSALLRRSGYQSVIEQSFLFGGIGLHWGRKKKLSAISTQRSAKHKKLRAGS